MRAMNKRDLRETFKQYDANGDGTISLLEFSRLLQALGAGMTDEELRIGFAEIDTDHSGSIDVEEFIAWWLD